MKNFKTEQESFWAGQFGSDYIDRNKSEKLLASNIRFFSDALKGIKKISSCMEFGANIGMNVKALQVLYPGVDFHGVEINSLAADQLSALINEEHVHRTSILDFEVERQWDLVFTKGVLIHINPEVLDDIYEKLFLTSRRYILLAEYYNPSPVDIPYRGYSNKLFKRDFAGDLMKKFPNVQLVDYGFSYHLDLNFPQDDITWFLMEKSN